MKIFLSHKMSSLSEEEVLKIREGALEKLKELYGEVELIENYYHDNVPANAGRIWHLGTSIRMMEEADAICFCKGWEESNGCIIEHKICELYGLRVLDEIDVDIQQIVSAIV